MGNLARRLYEEISGGFVEAEDELMALLFIYESQITQLIEKYEAIQYQDAIVPLHLNLIDGDINLKEFHAKELRVREKQVIIQQLEKTPPQKRTEDMNKEIDKQIEAFGNLFNDFEKTRLDIKNKVKERLIETNPFFAYLYENKLTNIEDIDKRISRAISGVFRRSIMNKTTFVDDEMLKKWVSRVQGALQSALSSIRLYSDSIMYSQPDTLDIIQKGLGLSNFLNDKLAEGFLDLRQAKKTITNLYGILRQTTQVINQLKFATKGKLIKMEAQQGSYSYDEDEEDYDMDESPQEVSLEEAERRFEEETLRKVDEGDSEVLQLAERIRQQSEKLNQKFDEYKSINIEQIPHQARKKYWAKLYRVLFENGFQIPEIINMMGVKGDLLDDTIAGKVPIANSLFVTMLEVGEQLGMDFQKEFKKYLKDSSKDMSEKKGE